MKIILIIAGVGTIIAVALFALDRLGLWLEDRGWIYYRRKGGSARTGVGNALVEFHSFFETEIQEARQEIREEKEEKSDIGAPPLGEESNQDHG